MRAIPWPKIFRATRFARIGGYFFAFTCLATLGAGCSESKQDDTVLDTSRLPRVSGAKEVFASAAVTTFTSPDPVVATAETVDKALGAAGWQKYVAPATATATDTNIRVMSLKKGPQAMGVFITTAPRASQRHQRAIHRGGVEKTIFPSPGMPAISNMRRTGRS